MIRNLLFIALLCLASAASAQARDLWGDTGVILTDDQTPVLVRVQRMNPQTHDRTIASLRGVSETTQTANVMPQEPAPVPGNGEVITAPPIPDIIGPPVYVGPTASQEPELEPAPVEEEPYGPLLTAPAPAETATAAQEIHPRADEVTTGGVATNNADTVGAFETASAAGLDDNNGPDISGVEIFVPETGEFTTLDAHEAEVPTSQEPTAEAPAPDTGEVQIAGVQSPVTIAPPVSEPETPATPQGPPPQFNSSAYTGLFTGVGIADGMRLQLNLTDASLSGTFIDRGGRNFRVDGQLTNEEGRAQALVVSAGQPVGYMDLQLTNLGLTSLFVPLDETRTPQTASARQYEFLRTLSPAAQSALEAERAAREASQGDVDRSRRVNTETVPEASEDGLQEIFPGDVDRDN